MESIASIFAVEDGSRKLFQNINFYWTTLASHLRRPMMLTHHDDSLRTNLLGSLFAVISEMGVM